MTEKNPAAVALGRMKKGVKEAPSSRKSQSSSLNLAKARQAKAEKRKPQNVE